jgi:hypothetical protein
MRAPIKAWKFIGGIILLAALASTVAATVTNRAAVPMGTATSWSAATGADPAAVQGPWWSSGNVQHLLAHDNGDNGDHDTYPVVNVADYPGATDMARFTAAIAAAPINSTLRVTKSLVFTSAVTINKSLSLVIEANTSITTTNASITISASNVSLLGRGPTSQIIQGAANTDIFTVTSTSGLNVEDIAFTGVAGTLTNHNSAFKVSATTDILIERCTFTNFQWHTILTQGSNRVTVVDNTFVGNIAWLASGGTALIFSRNIVRDPQFANTVFVIPLQFDSTSGGFGNAADVTVANNQFFNWTSSQCIELHTGNHFNVSGNLLENCYIGVSVNTFQAGDIAQQGVISGNTIISSTTSGISTTIPSIPISMTGLVAAPVQEIAITGNYLFNGNIYSNNDNWGCINVAGNVNDASIVGNVFDTCAGNGIAMVGANTKITIIANHMSNFLDTTPSLIKTGVGVWTTTGQTGFIADNDINGTRVGIRLDVSSSVVVGQNNFTNLSSSDILNPSNGTVTSFTDGYNLNNIGAAQTVAQSYGNLTAAAAGAQQSSPCVEFLGQGWDSTNTVSKTIKCCWQLTPVQTAGNPTGNYSLFCSSNGAAYAEKGRISSAGAFYATAGTDGFDTIGSGAGNLFTNHATSVSIGNSGVSTLGFAATTINLGTGTNTTTNISKAGATVQISGRLQNGLPEVVGANIASASTIAPTSSLTHITGTVTIQTITAPTNFAQTNGGGCLQLVADGAWATNTAGNINTAFTATTGNVYLLCYDNGTTKWYIAGADTAVAATAAGTWAPEEIGTSAVSTNFIRPYQTVANTPKMRNVACSWTVAGTLGSVGVVAQVVDTSNSNTELCNCTLGACTTTALTPLVCDCNSAAITAGHAYAFRLKSTSDCSVFPQNIACSVELTQ